MNVLSAAATLQRLYERGRLSYPRADENAGFDEATTNRLEALAERNGLQPVRPVPRWKPGPNTPHETPHPLDVDDAEQRCLHTPAWMLTPGDAAMSRFLRWALRWTTGIEDEVAEPDDECPEWVKGLEFRRDSATTPAMLRSAELENAQGEDELVLYPADEIALLGLEAAGLGRPSSLATHATQIAERKYVNSGGLTPRGVDVLNASPESLCAPGVSGEVFAASERITDSSANMDALLSQVLGPVWSETRIWLGAQDAPSGVSGSAPGHDDRPDPDRDGEALDFEAGAAFNVAARPGPARSM